MKPIKYFFLSAFMLMASVVVAQDDSRISADDVNNKNFIFHAQSAIPLGGRNIILNFPYDCRLTADSLISNLPYFGRAFSAPMNAQDAGLTFNSTQFTYDVVKSNDKKFEVTIETKDQRDDSKYYFTFYSNGQAQLMVQPFNKQSIRYDGTVEKFVKK